MRLDMEFAKYAVFCGSLAVMALGLAREAMVLQIGTQTLLQDLRQFDLDAENSVPAWWSASMLLAASLSFYVLAARAHTARASVWRLWLILSLAFLLLSIDEAASFHEGAIAPLRAAFGFSGAFFYAWTVPALVCLGVFGAAILPLLRHVPRALLWRMVTAGAVFVAGALGMEMVGGWLDYEGLRGTRWYAVSISIEEGCEILGVTLLLAALFDALAGRYATTASRAPGRARPAPAISAYPAAGAD